MNAPYLAQVSEQGEMGITDELRNEANKMDWIRSAVLRGIADRIDAEHKRLMAEQFESLTVDMQPMTDENMAESGWIRLPKDADGVPIYIGDILHDDCSNEPCDLFEVEYMQLKKDGWMVVDKAGWCHYPNDCRHYHEPTVEDVLREFAEKMSENISMYTSEAIDADEWRDADNKTIAEYAAKLSLANDGKEQ